MPPDINHNDEVFAIKHDIENKKFILKLNDSAAEISVPYILDLNNSGDCIGYKVFLLKNDVKNKENDIFQVFDNGQRIGWIFTIQSLQSGAHDWAQNEHFLKIAYFAFKALLEKIDIKRSDLVGKCELKLSDCYDTDDIVFIVCEQEFDINFYLPSFYRYGYYFQTDIEIKSSGDLSVFDEPHSKNNICIKRISPFFEEIRNIFEPSCATIRGWDNKDEIKNNMKQILLSLSIFIGKFFKYEKPLLMQPIWKTIGKSAELAENCLDIFIWSDFALTKLFMESALSYNRDRDGISRPERTAVRLARFLYEMSSRNRVYQAPIYDGMTFGTQNDKEFAIPGNKTNIYMSCDRLTKPIITKREIKNIILDGGQKWLSPERRFDAIIYFSKELFDE